MSASFLSGCSAAVEAARWASFRAACDAFVASKRKAVLRIGGPRRTPAQRKGAPATLDLLGALQETAALVLAGHDLQSIRAVAVARAVR